jgi:hypothetical protein
MNRPGITEMCLNYKRPWIEGIYDVHTYFDERKQALTMRSSYLAGVESAFAALLKPQTRDGLPQKQP